MESDEFSPDEMDYAIYSSFHALVQGQPTLAESVT